MMIGYQAPALIVNLLPHLIVLLSKMGDTTLLGSGQIRLTSLSVLGMIIPLLCIAALSGATAVLMQTNFLINLGAIEPKYSRVSPVAGLKRLFGSNGLVEIVKSLGKLGLLVTAFWIAIRGDMSLLTTLPWQNAHILISAVTRLAFHLFVATICIQTIVAAADLMWVRFRHFRDMRMSKQSIRDESKDTEGNPHIKARIRRIRVMRARKRMMAKVPTATVVITNPTHYAIALVYDRANNPAPRIVAKGQDSLAARIRKVAEANGVPVVANPPLARALHRLEIDTEIPAEHYKAVAEVIAYVWRLRRSGQAAF
jgi:flagellar biosynthetic protein FlhB